MPEAVQTARNRARSSVGTLIRRKVRHCIWSLVLVIGTTTTLIVILLTLHWLGTLCSALALVAMFCLIVVLLGAPFFVVPLHLRWQRPAESSVTLAFFTGLASWLVATVLWFIIHLYTYGP